MQKTNLVPDEKLKIHKKVMQDSDLETANNNKKNKEFLKLKKDTT